MSYKGILLFFVIFIGLHAIAMSEGSDNTTEQVPIYGFAPDQSRWRHYATDADNTIYFYDRKSVVKHIRNMKVWIKFGDPINYENTSKIYKEATELKELDCYSRLVRSMELSFQTVKGEQERYASPTKWENIEPETSEDALFEEICRYVNKRKAR